jgi:hypothetical protein
MKEDEIGGACLMYGRDEYVQRVSVGKPKEKGPLGRIRSKWEDN